MKFTTWHDLARAELGSAAPIDSHVPWRQALTGIADSASLSIVDRRDVMTTKLILLTALLAALFSMAATAQVAFDAELAEKLEADQYGMKMYVMAFLKAGANRDRRADEAQRLQRAHMANINRLAAEGKLVVAGPFADNGLLRGVYIFDVPTVAEAEALTSTDPAVQAGSLVMELHPW